MGSVDWGGGWDDTGGGFFLLKREGEGGIEGGVA